MATAKIIVGDVRTALARIKTGTIQTCITSPPYWGLRDYGNDNQIGLEKSPDEYVSELVKVFREVKRVLRDDGTLWLNLGDSYSSFRDSKVTPDSLRTGDGTKVSIANNRNPLILKASGLKHKDLVGIPWMVAFALRADGWWLRQDIIWAKPNPMPESVTDRCTKSHEYLFLLTKSARYYYDNDAIREPSVSSDSLKRKRWQNGGNSKESLSADKAQDFGVMLNNPLGRNKRDVWTINTKPFKGAHFAVMPEALVEPCILAGSKAGDVVLDPFTGSGTVGVVALKHGRDFVGTEVNPEYAVIAENRISNSNPMFDTVTKEQ